MELVVVPWAPGPLIRVEWPGPARDLKLGLPIDPSDPDVSALIGAYESLLAAATQGGLIAAGHVALRKRRRCCGGGRRSAPPNASTSAVECGPSTT
jgi:hypothetical protein